MNRPALLALALLAPVVIALPARAITRRDDITEAQTITLASSLPVFGAVGNVGNFCSGTLIADTWVLTAAHCAALNPTGVIFNGTLYSVAQVISHPGYNGIIENGFDIALLRLSAPVVGVTPAQIYTDTDELGKPGYHVGIGYQGIGSTGHNGTGLGTKRAIQNVADVLGGSVAVAPGDPTFSNDYLVADFDSPANAPTRLSAFGSSDTPMAFEGSIAPGDSGGGFFLQDSGGNWKVAGVHSWIDGILPGGDGSDNASYTDLLASTRVSTYASWIQSNVSPEPGSLALILPALALVSFTLRRKNIKKING
jgi:hypothetical protein